MRRTIEYDLVTKIEANARFASKAGMFAKSGRTKAQREATRQVLQHLGAPPPHHVIRRSDGAHVGLGAAIGLTVPNVIKVRFTRIAPGQTADAWENLPGAFKGVKDEVAAWIGCDDKEGRGITWLPPEQEKGDPAVYRVRIEIEDLLDGEPKTVVLAERASEGRLAKTRMKRQITAEKKRQASPSAYDLRDAAERALARPRELTARERKNILGGKMPKPDCRPFDWRCPNHGIRCTMKSVCMRADPGEEAPARDLADCSTCGARAGVACRRVGSEKLVHGVHEGRARAAGVHRRTEDGVYTGTKIARVSQSGKWSKSRRAPALPGSREAAQAECDDANREMERIRERRAATVPGEPRLVPRPCFVRLPWSTKAVRDERLDRRDRDVQSYRVPAEHREKWGNEVLLTRERAEDAEHGVYWLYSKEGSLQDE